MFPTKAHGVESVGSTSDSSTDTSVFEKPIEKAILNPADDVPSLPPTDHGSQAYLVLAGCTFIQAPVWGFSMSFGVFQNYYTATGKFGSAGRIATVGTTLNGLMYLMMPVTFTLLTKYPRLRPYTGPLGLFLTVVSLIGSSFAENIWQLILSQGVLCAVGTGLLFSPTTLYLDEWFSTRKSLAYGIMWAGKAAAGAVIPFIMQGLLDKYQSENTLRAWAVALVVLTAPLLYYLKPRIPISPDNTRRPLSWTFLRKPAFWMLQTGNIIQGLGYLLPPTYLASYAKDIGIQSQIKGAMLIAVVSLANVPGSMFSGFLGDRYPAVTVILISSIGSSMAVLLLWGLTAQLALLVLFAALYGFFAGGFSSAYSAIAKEMKRADEGVEDGVVMGLLLGARGIGFMVGGPMSAALLKSGQQDMTFGFASQYGRIIIFTGVTALFGSCGWMWTTLKATCDSSEPPVICLGHSQIRRPIPYNAL